MKTNIREAPPLIPKEHCEHQIKKLIKSSIKKFWFPKNHYFCIKIIFFTTINNKSTRSKPHHNWNPISSLKEKALILKLNRVILLLHSDFLIQKILNFKINNSSKVNLCSNNLDLIQQELPKLKKILFMKKRIYNLYKLRERRGNNI